LVTKTPLVTAARLAQEDFLILEQTPDAHVLTSAVLCFPASWTLGQKIGRNMLGIHQPVDRYDENIARRVNRVMDVLQQGNAVWRANVLCYNDPELHQPRLEHERRPFDPAGPVYVRVERAGPEAPHADRDRVLDSHLCRAHRGADIRTGCEPAGECAPRGQHGREQLMADKGHILPDRLAPNLRVWFVGTAAGADVCGDGRLLRASGKSLLACAA
jgi:hypothetical protein